MVVLAALFGLSAAVLIHFQWKEGRDERGQFIVGRMDQGIDVELRLEETERVTIRAVGAEEGLPPNTEGGNVNRPRDRMPLYEYDGLSMALRTYRF